MAKRIRVSIDDTTYYTLPGAAGELRTELAAIDDTVFGQEWQSESPSIGMWSVQGSAFFKGVAGYSAVIKRGGTPTSVTAEATAQIGATKSYQVVDVAKRAVDYASALIVYDDAVDATADVVSIDYLNGIVTFDSGYTVVGAVTLDFYYVPLTVLGCGRSFNLQQACSEIDGTCYDSAQSNGGWRVYDYGLRTVGLELGNVWKSTKNFITDLAARATIYVDVSPNGTQGVPTTEVLFRGFFKYMQQGQSGNVGALEEETLNLNLFVPSGELLAAPFKWYFGTAHSLSPAIALCLNAWQNGTSVYVEYLADGVNGEKGSAIVTDCSLQNSLEGQNEFSFTFKGSGAPTAVP